MIWTFTAFKKPWFIRKTTFRVIFEPIRGHAERYCFDMGIFERSACMNVIWYSGQNIHGLEMNWTSIAFDKSSFSKKNSFRGIFEPIRGHTERCCFDMGIFERSAQMNVIWYSCQNIHGLEMIWDLYSIFPTLDFFLNNLPDLENFSLSNVSFKYLVFRAPPGNPVGEIAMTGAVTGWDLDSLCCSQGRECPQ